MSINTELEQLRAEVGRLRDKDAIVTLQSAYGYYVDKAQWDEAADLFARHATLEIAGRGLFRGVDRIRAYLHALPPLTEGTVFNHMQLQPLITLGADGDTALGRWRAWMNVGFVGRESMWGEGTYENAYVREDGVWKIARLHFFVTYYVDYDKGWTHGGVPLAGPLPEMIPDETQTVAYGAFPQVFIPPFHYANPVTGKAWSGAGS